MSETGTVLPMSSQRESGKLGRGALRDREEGAGLLRGRDDGTYVWLKSDNPHFW